ncbi:hypothetical protein D6D17_02431 [Aureobasidium pullulans]|nr:hypothetical protein D6D17_02431 [Aureobasidium pullulans]
MAEISLASAIAVNDKWSKARPLTAVFSTQGLCLFLVGRNKTAASAILSDCRKLCPSGEFHFVQASDLSLMHDVDVACEEIKKLVGESSTDKGAEQMKDWDENDMSFCNAKRYNMSRARTHVIVMKTLSMEKLAAQNIGKVSFVHVYPGLVITPAFGNQDLPTWFRAMWTVAKPFVNYLAGRDWRAHTLFVFVPKDFHAHAGDKTIKLAMSTDGIIGGGAYACKHDAETIDVQAKYKSFRASKVDERVREHTLSVFSQIQENGVFKG